MMVEAVLLQAQQFEVMEALSRVGKLRFGFMLILLRCLGLHIFATTHGLRSTLVPLLSFEIGVRPCCVSFMGFVHGRFGFPLLASWRQRYLPSSLLSLSRRTFGPVRPGSDGHFF